MNLYTERTIHAPRYLVNRDGRMRVKLERAIGLTEAAASAEEEKHAQHVQRVFAVHWELAAMIGGIVAYIRSVCTAVRVSV